MGYLMSFVQGQGGAKNITGGPIHSEEMNIIDGALKFRYEDVLQ